MINIHQTNQADFIFFIICHIECPFQKSLLLETNKSYTYVTNWENHTHYLGEVVAGNENSISVCIKEETEDSPALMADFYFPEPISWEEKEAEFNARVVRRWAASN